MSTSTTDINTTTTKTDRRVVDAAPLSGVRRGLVAALLAVAAVTGCSSDSDGADNPGDDESDSSTLCAELFVAGEAAPADTAGVVVESPGVVADEVIGAVECVDGDGAVVFQSVFQWDCDDGRTAYYVNFNGADGVAWEDGGTAYAIPIGPGPGDLCP